MSITATLIDIDDQSSDLQHSQFLMDTFNDAQKAQFSHEIDVTYWGQTLDSLHR